MDIIEVLVIGLIVALAFVLTKLVHELLDIRAIMTSTGTHSLSGESQKKKTMFVALSRELRRHMMHAKRYLGASVLVAACASVFVFVQAEYREGKCVEWYESLDSVDVSLQYFALSGDDGRQSFLQMCIESGNPALSATILDTHYHSKRAASSAGNAASSESLRDVERNLERVILSK